MLRWTKSSFAQWIPKISSSMSRALVLRDRNGVLSRLTVLLLLLSVVASACSSGTRSRPSALQLRDTGVALVARSMRMAAPWGAAAQAPTFHSVDCNPPDSHEVQWDFYGQVTMRQPHSPSTAIVNLIAVLKKAGFKVAYNSQFGGSIHAVSSKRDMSIDVDESYPQKVGWDASTGCGSP
jgi:hypothetical protein